MRKISLICLTLFVVILTAPAYADGYGGVTLSAWTDIPPIIDGDLNSFTGEWAKADSVDFQTTYPINGTMYVMNNATHLFVFVRIDETESGKASCFVLFDSDHDRVEWEDNDDAIYYGHHPDEGFRDCHYDASAGSFFYMDDSQDGMGGYSCDAEYRCFEFSHPLFSGEAQDFSLIIGDTVGFQLSIWTQDIGTEYWPSPAISTNDIIIAVPPRAPAIGGEILSLNLTQIALPFLLIALVIAVGTLGFKKRIMSK